MVVTGPFLPKNTSEKVYCGIKQLLFDGEVVPGQKLQCQDFADKFGVSRTPVKEAFQMLSAEGYLDLRHNRGFYVCERSPRELEDLYDVRVALEMVALERGIERQTPATLKKLADAIATHASDADKVITRKRLLNDLGVHLAIAELSANETIVAHLEVIITKILLNIKLNYLAPTRGLVSRKEHQEIYDAILKKNVSRGRKVLYAHLMHSLQNATVAQSYLSEST